MNVEFFNHYDIRVPVVAENTATKESYTCNALPKQRGELLEGYTLSTTTLASYPKIQELNKVSKSDKKGKLDD